MLLTLKFRVITPKLPNCSNDIGIIVRDCTWDAMLLHWVCIRRAMLWMLCRVRVVVRMSSRLATLGEPEALPSLMDREEQLLS